MYVKALDNLRRLAHSDHAHSLGERLIGIEKESLRVAKDGSISQRPHPRGLGSALTHSAITTDYSEALLEIVTPPFADIRETLGYLCDTHRYIYANLEADEFLWATSM
ncbi:MAG TPA: glutamate--cysteine ligase, partial [Gammaproteobacteria bacterium]|nr:glutamate--cysteine ligase [Gammaproteobacteria bacterium]